MILVCLCLCLRVGSGGGHLVIVRAFIRRYGPRDIRSIATFVRTRSATQVRTHAQKFYLRMQREGGVDAKSVMSDAGASHGAALAAENENDTNDDGGSVLPEFSTARSGDGSTDGDAAGERGDDPPRHSVDAEGVRPAVPSSTNTAGAYELDGRETKRARLSPHASTTDANGDGS